MLTRQGKTWLLLARGRRWCAVLITAVLIMCGLCAPAAHAATRVDFTPRTILAPGVPATGYDQNVVAVGSVSLAMTATQTAYVVSVMTVDSATIRSLFDNEVRCSGPNGYQQNFVIGKNVYQKGGAPYDVVSLTTRFLVHPGTAGTVTCTAFVRSASLGYDDAYFRLASGYLTFANTSIMGASNGAMLQQSTPAGIYPVTPTSTIQRLPALDMVDVNPAATGLSVIADTEFMVCPNSSNCNKSGSAAATFTLYVNQWKSDGTLCKQEKVATTANTPYWVHHDFVPLNIAHFTLSAAAGCIPRVNAYVLVNWTGGNEGAVQGAANGLTDLRGSTTTHNSAMSHISVVPY